MKFEQECCPDCGGEPRYTEEKAPIKYFLTRDRKGGFKIDDNEVMYEFSENHAPGVSKLVCGQCGSDWLSRNEAGEGLELEYRVVARHTQGRSVAHSCKPGVYDDPAEQLDENIKATSWDQAMTLGWEKLRALVRAWEPCGCERDLNPGSMAWWQSVEVTAWL